MLRKTLFLGVLTGVLFAACVAAAADPQEAPKAFTPLPMKAAYSADDKAQEAKSGAAGKVELKPMPSKAVVEVKKEGEEAKAEKDKWWHVSFSYTLSHNVAKERPQVGNSFGVDPSFSLPYKLNLNAHIGFGVMVNYKSAVSGGSDVTYQQTDMDPILISLGRSFDLEPKYSKLKLSAKIDQLIPYVSKYAGQKDEWYYAVKPSVGLSVSRWGLTLSNSFAVQKNAHKHTYSWILSEDDGARSPMPLNSWVISDMTSLRYNIGKWDMGIAAGYVLPFRYKQDRVENQIGVVRAAADVTYQVLDELSLTLSIENAGPERYNGGFKSDRNYPFKRPEFTNIAFTVSYTL